MLTGMVLLASLFIFPMWKITLIAPQYPDGVTLRIYIDKESGIGLDDCQLVSQQISGVLDLEDPIPGAYTLEVSSAGLDRPLFEPEHYLRFVGRGVRIHLDLPMDGRRKLTGTIKGLREGNVVLESEGRELLVPLDSINKARLVPKF